MNIFCFLNSWWFTHFKIPIIVRLWVWVTFIMCNVFLVFFFHFYSFFVPKLPAIKPTSRNLNSHDGHPRAAKKPSTDGVSLDYFLSELSDDDSTSWWVIFSCLMMNLLLRFAWNLNLILSIFAILFIYMLCLWDVSRLKLIAMHTFYTERQQSMYCLRLCMQYLKNSKTPIL
jgi:hypothetical protein